MDEFSENNNELSENELSIAKSQGCLLNRDRTLFSVRVITRNGVLTAAEMAAAAQAAEKFGTGAVALTTRLTVEIQGVPYENLAPLRDFLETHGLLTGGTGAKVRPIVACKGTVCVYGLIDTQGLALKIHKAFYEGYRHVGLPQKFKITVGGCPNNCAKADLNDIGIIGQRVPFLETENCRGCAKCAAAESCPVNAYRRNGKKPIRDEALCTNCGRCIGKCRFGAVTEAASGYKVYIGGRWGKRTRLGTPFGRLPKSEEEVLTMIEKVLLYFRENAEKGERFAVMIDRIGVEKVFEALDADDVLSRKREILDRVI